MLLFRPPFGLREGVRREGICPELRPPLVAIYSMHDTAHRFPASGSSVVLASAVQRGAIKQTRCDV
jgi:hypothetical protein